MNLERERKMLTGTEEFEPLEGEKCPVCGIPYQRTSNSLELKKPADGQTTLWMTKKLIFHHHLFVRDNETGEQLRHMIRDCLER